MLVHNPADVDWFDRSASCRLARTRATGDPGALQLAADNVPEGLAILDAPDIDSVEERNRVLAAELLAAADLWLFVTSAARYADQVPWEFLKAAADRSTAVAIVLDRTPPDAVAEVSGHLARMLTARGLQDSPLFAVTEGVVDEDGLLAPEHVQEIAVRLVTCTPTTRRRRGAREADPRRRGASLSPYRHRGRRRRPADDGDAARADVDRAYDEAIEKIDDASADSLLRGEVLARWQEFVGTGELFRNLETSRLASRPRGRLGPRQADAGRAGDRRGRVRVGDADPGARRDRRRARGGLLALGAGRAAPPRGLRS